jgi:hypothetical protein
MERGNPQLYDVLYASNSHASQRAFRFLHIFTSPPQMNFWELKVCFSIKSAYISLVLSHNRGSKSGSLDMQAAAIGAA